MLRFLTAGESHGKCLVAVLEGLPSGIPIRSDVITREMKRRQHGYGRGPRMGFEPDIVEILSGVRRGKTIGSPIAVQIANKDTSIEQLPIVTNPRPGHADLAGSMKYDQHDARNILERASARETAARVAIGAICRQLLSEIGIELASHVISVGTVKARPAESLSALQIRKRAESSPLRCLDASAASKMVKLVDLHAKKGDTLGGSFEVVADGLPPGLGSHVHYDRRLDARLAAALMSVQALKAVEIGDGILSASVSGSHAQDEIFYRKSRGFYRSHNRSGGIEGGMTMGQPVVIRGFVKPLSTLKRPLHSVDMITKKAVKATVERTDVCVVPAAGVVAEAMVAFELARAALEKFGGDSLRELARNYQGYLRQLKQF